MEDGMNSIPVEKRFWENLSIVPEGCWEWLGSCNSRGYGRLSNGHAGDRIFTHRLSWILHYGPIPPGMCVLHKCDNPLCCRPDHLFLGTHAMNMHDMAIKGRAGQRGEHGSNTKLSERDVKEIRQLKGWIKCDKLAMNYHVSKTQIINTWNYKTWKHLP